MPSHLSSIGLPINDPVEFTQLIEKLAASASPADIPAASYLTWSSSCGAEVWIQLDRAGDIIGVNPYFAGQSSVTVGLTARISRDNDSPLDGAFQGWANPHDSKSDAEGDYPFVFDVVDGARYRHLAIPSRTKARIAAFAHEVTTYRSVDEYDRLATDGVKFASRSFIPSGLFTPAGDRTVPPEAHAIFTGHIAASSIKTSDLTGANYFWALVDSLGAIFDVVIDPEICTTEPQVGGVLTGSFWLSARLMEFVEEKPSMWNRMFG